MQNPFIRYILPLTALAVVTLALFLWRDWPLEVWFIYVAVVGLFALTLVRARVQRKNSIVRRQAAIRRAQQKRQPPK